MTVFTDGPRILRATEGLGYDDQMRSDTAVTEWSRITIETRKDAVSCR